MEIIIKFQDQMGFNVWIFFTRSVDVFFPIFFWYYCLPFLSLIRLGQPDSNRKCPRMPSADRLLWESNGRDWEKAAAKDVSNLKQIITSNLCWIFCLIIPRDPSIKRTICKSCKGLLIAGVTASVKIRSVGKTSQKKKPKRKVKTQEWTCLQCHSVRNFVLKSDYMLWSEKCQEMSQ